MNIKSATVFDVIRLVDLASPGTAFFVFVAPPDDGRLFAELQKELEAQSHTALSRIDARKLDAIGLLEELAQRPDAVVLIDGLEQWDDEQFTSLDINRSRLETGAFIIFKGDLSTIARFLDCAPNLRSFVGPEIPMAVPDPSVMTAEQIENRLHQLRSHYQLSDEEVVEQARRGIAPAEPEFAEWLFLLGRNELVR